MELTLGQTLRKVRIEKNLKEKYICDGICSAAMMTYYEKGLQVPDCLLFIRLMERMGVSSEEFTLMVSENEYTYLKWQAQVYDAIEKEEWKELGKLLNHNIKESNWINEKLQKQFFYYARGIYYGNQEEYDSAEKELKKSMEFTISSDAIEKKTVLLDTMELHVLLLYMFYGRKSKLLDAEEAKRLFDMIEAYIHDGIMDRNEKAKTYPKLVCVALNCIEDLLSEKEKMVLCEKAVNILRENKTFHDITELLRLYIPLLEKAQSSDLKFYKKQYEVFCDLLQEEDISIAFRPEIQGIHKAKVYLKHEYLSSMRRDKRLTQEKVSEDVCTPETYSRLERGERAPSRRNFKALAEKLDINWVQYRGEIVSTDLEAYRLRRLERRAGIEGRWKDRLEVLQKLEQCLDMRIVENYQYVKASECISKVRLKVMDIEDACEIMEELLDMTSKLDADSSHLVYYSQTEMEIIAYLAEFYHLQRNTRAGIEIIETVIKQMSYSKLDYEDQWNGFSLLFRILARLYFAIGEYSVSIKISQYVKHIMSRRRNAGNLPVVLDEIADGLEHKGEQYSKEYKRLYRYTYYVADLFEIEDIVDFAKKYYEEKFDTDTKWY